MKNISISSRNENTLDKRAHDVPLTKLQELKNQFDENIESIQNRFVIADSLRQNEDQVKDIYRSQVVFLESALDYYIHCLSIHASIQMANGYWKKSGGFSDLSVPIEKVFEAIKNPEDTRWIDEIILRHHSTKTYMHSSEIKGQLTFISNDKGLFDAIAKKMYYDKGSTEKPQDKLRNLLNNVFSRRNKIAHQADRDHKTGIKFDIEKIEVETYINEISDFVKLLHEIITEE